MSPNQYCSLLQIHQITSLASHVSLWWTHICQNLCICTCLRYLSAMLATWLPILDHPHSHATYAKKPVCWTTPGPGVCCDTCDQWFHKACMGMNTCIYESPASNNVSWQCCRWGMPNFSSSFFDYTISILSPSSSSIADSRTILFAELLCEYPPDAIFSYSQSSEKSDVFSKSAHRYACM